MSLPLSSNLCWSFGLLLPKHEKDVYTLFEPYVISDVAKIIGAYTWHEYREEILSTSKSYTLAIQLCDANYFLRIKLGDNELVHQIEIGGGGPFFNKLTTQLGFKKPSSMLFEQLVFDLCEDVKDAPIVPQLIISKIYGANTHYITDKTNLVEIFLKSPNSELFTEFIKLLI
jgi:hypothetical protein